MREEIKVSVIIPTYGKPIYLDKAIQSVLRQSLEDIELIVVDDNDVDTEARKLTEAMVNREKEKDSRIVYIKHERNRNGAAARNTGIAVARGKYISFLDSDDEYMPDRLRQCYDIMEAKGREVNVAGVYTGCEFRRRGAVYNRYTGVRSGRFMVETLACSFMFCTGSNIFVRKRVVDELKGFDEAFRRHQDYEFLVRVFEKYSIIAIPDILVIKNNENFNLPDAEKMILVKRQYLEKFKPIIDRLSDEDRRYVFHTNCVSVAETAMAQRKYKLALQYYKKATTYGHLARRELFRCLVYPLYNLIVKR